jgi:hypothetical protein
VAFEIPTAVKPKSAAMDLTILVLCVKRLEMLMVEFAKQFSQIAFQFEVNSRLLESVLNDKHNQLWVQFGFD